MLELRARLSPHHRHVLAGLVRGEDSEADSEAGGGEARHQHGDDGAHAGRGLGGARHEEGEGDVLYPTQYETLGVVSGDVPLFTLLSTCTDGKMKNSRVVFQDLLENLNVIEKWKHLVFHIEYSY